MSFISAPAAASGLTLLQTVTASNSATVDLETGISGSYDHYLIAFDDVTQTAIDGNYLDVRLKIGGSYRSTNEYATTAVRVDQVSNSVLSFRANASARIVLGIDISNNVARSVSGQLWFSNPTSTTQRKSVNWACSWPGLSFSDAQLPYTGGGSFWGSTAALTGVRFFLDSGNILTGNFRLYGLART